MSGRADTWMPLYVGDYIADTMHLNGPQHGAYFLLILHYWRQGPPPDDDATLAMIARTDAKVWIKEIGPIVRRFFSAENGLLHHKRIDKELKRAVNMVEQRRRAGIASAVQRKAQRKGNEKPTDVERALNGRSDLVDIPLEQNGRPSPSPSQKENTSNDVSKKPTPDGVPVAADPPKKTAEPERTVARPKPRGMIPDDWQPDKAGVKYATDRNIPKTELEKFRDYHLRKGTLFADVSAGWRTWCRNAVEFRKRDTPAINGDPFETIHQRMTGVA